jgi:PAS domain S-box-containing protein
MDTRKTMLNLFQSTTDGACGVDHQQRIVLWNPAAEALLGYQPQEVLGRHCFEVFCGQDETGRRVCRYRCQTSRIALSMAAVPTRDLRVQTKNGDGLWLSVTTIPLPSRWQQHAMLVHLFRDVSRYKTCQDALDRLLVDITGPPPAVPDVGRSTGADRSTPAEDLTRREQEVLGLLAAGKSTREIAETLVVSPSTARNHIHNMLAKLEAHSRLEAVTIAMRDGLL